MDLASFLIGLLPVVAVGFVCVVAFRRRRRRGTAEGSPLVVNPYTLAMEPNADVHGSLPIIQPAPATTTSQTFRPPAR